MKMQVSDVDAKRKFGLSTNHEVMENGELRFRLKDSNGFGYVRTHAPKEGVWQNSHKHTGFSEVYVVQTGWLIFVEMAATGKVAGKLYEAGGVFQSNDGIAHNVYAGPNSVFHVVKSGENSAANWQTDEDTKELDALTSKCNANPRSFLNHVKDRE